MTNEQIRLVRLEEQNASQAKRISKLEKEVKTIQDYLVAMGDLVIQLSHDSIMEKLDSLLKKDGVDHDN